MTKALQIAALLATIASTAGANTSTNCYWIGSTYTCTTVGGGTYSTTRCYTIGNTVRCSTY
jgi:hypothetical protein